MRVKHKDIEFRISRRTLWVGDHAYPLSGVTRIRRVDLKPHRTRILRRFFSQAGAWVGLAVAALIFVACAGESVPSAVSVAVVVIALGIVGLLTVRLIRNLTLPRMYVLSLATAGSNHETLVSTDKQLIDDLIHRVVDAIDNPAMEYMIRVEHLEITQGDKVFGGKFGGDQVQGNKIENWS